jgi:hypothetical protein
MLKFLRKYNKWILVVGGAFLMVAFLLPQTLEELGRGLGSRSTYLRVGGEKISAVEADLAHRELAALRTLGLGDNTRDVDTWLLLTHEAGRAGLIGGPQSGRDEVPAITSMIAQQVYFQMMREGQRPDPARLEETARNIFDRMLVSAAQEGRFSLDQVYAAIAKVKAVERLRQAYSQGLARASDRRVILRGRHDYDSARVDSVFLAGERVCAPIPAADDAALQALFERFKGVRKGEGEFGLGYTLPPRVKVEWISLDRAAWSDLVRVDPLEVRNRYLRDNKGKADAAASGPEFEAARPGIEAQIRKETLDKALAEASKVIKADIARATLRLEKAGDYYVLPADWATRKPDFHQMRDHAAARVKAETGLDIPAPPVTVRAAGWLEASDLAALPGIGGAFQKRGNTAVGFPQLALQVREIAGANAANLQAMVPYGPIEDYAGNHYYFTILDARRESPPDDWREIREVLARDFERLESFKVLESQVDEYRRQAAAEGLDAVARALVPSPIADAADYVATSPDVRRNLVVSRQSTLPADLNTEAVKSAVVEAAAKFDPTVNMELFDAGLRTVVVAVPSRLGVAVFRITAYLPATIEKLRAEDRTIAARIRDKAMEDLKDDPFSPARLKERLRAEVPESRRRSEQAGGAETEAGL